LRAPAGHASLRAGVPDGRRGRRRHRPDPGPGRRATGPAPRPHPGGRPDVVASGTERGHRHGPGPGSRRDQVRTQGRLTTNVAVTDVPFKVADIDLADFGRKEIRLAEEEMPGLM